MEWQWKCDEQQENKIIDIFMIIILDIFNIQYNSFQVIYFI